MIKRYGLDNALISDNSGDEVPEVTTKVYQTEEELRMRVIEEGLEVGKEEVNMLTDE